MAAEPFQDPKLPLEERVNNLVSLLTLDEKISLLGQNLKFRMARERRAILLAGIAASSLWADAAWSMFRQRKVKSAH